MFLLVLSTITWNQHLSLFWATKPQLHSMNYTTCLWSVQSLSRCGLNNEHMLMCSGQLGEHRVEYDFSLSSLIVNKSFASFAREENCFDSDSAIRYQMYGFFKVVPYSLGVFHIYFTVANRTRTNAFNISRIQFIFSKCKITYFLAK